MAAVDDAADRTSPGLDWHGATLTPLAGGYSGETFLVGDDPADQVVLRVYARDPQRCLVDASLLRLVHGIVPVPEVVDVRRPYDDNPGLLVTTRLPGERLDQVLPEASSALQEAIGHSCGRVLAALSGMPMLRFGVFEGEDLRLGEGLPDGGLAGWVDVHRDRGPLAAWSEADIETLRAVASDADVLLDGGEGRESQLDVALTRRVLVHSDVNPKNLLVDPATGEITGLLDWEFAHAGSPYTDLGNLTRFDRQPAFVEAVTQKLVAHAPPLAANLLDLARAVDLWALIDLAAREERHVVADLALAQLAAIARSGDLHALPSQPSR